MFKQIEGGSFYTVLKNWGVPDIIFPGKHHSISSLKIDRIKKEQPIKGCSFSGKNSGLLITLHTLILNAPARFFLQHMVLSQAR